MRTPEQIIGRDRLLQLIFEGYVVVPAKPTAVMIDAASDFHGNGKWSASDDSIYGGIYGAMINAVVPT